MTEFSYQLYSSRNFPPLGDTLRMLANLGYAQVEGFGGLFADQDAVDALAAGLAETGLKMPTAHFGLDLLADPDRALSIAKTLGIETVFCPFVMPDDRPSDAAGWAAFGKTVAEAGNPIWDAGLNYGWHNHDFEFVALDDGQFPFDLIMAADDRLVAELDLAWVVRGGQDPLVWLQKYSDRTASVHLKDLAAPGENADEDGWADVGHGTMDWAALMGAARQTSAQYFVMEHDNPSDHHRFASRALASAKSY